VLSRFHQGQQPQNQQQWRRQADWINGAAITTGQSPKFQQQLQPAQPIQRRSAAAAAAASPTQIEAQQTNSPVNRRGGQKAEPENGSKLGGEELGAKIDWIAIFMREIGRKKYGNYMKMKFCIKWGKDGLNFI
jgi:hypothetical protein